MLPHSSCYDGTLFAIVIVKISKLLLRKIPKFRLHCLASSTLEEPVAYIVIFFCRCLNIPLETIPIFKQNIYCLPFITSYNTSIINKKILFVNDYSSINTANNMKKIEKKTIFN